jgi:excisionase family DNA binding protein
MLPAALRRRRASAEVTVLRVVLGAVARLVFMNIHSNAQGIPRQPAGLLSLQEAALTLGISRSTLARLVARDQLRPVRIGRRVLIEPDDVEALIAAGRCEASVRGSSHPKRTSS